MPVAPGARVRGEDLIADLFEAMHDLHFVRDALEGGEFCLALAMEKLPSQAGIVHLYDIDRREFLVASTRGAGTKRLLLRRHPENEPLLLASVRKRRAVVVADGSQADGASAERYTMLGGARSLLIAPILLHGRLLGAIELVNPLDGQPFNESEGNALTYIAEQFAEFISSHGIVTDPERISQRPAPEA
jgi:GAF domain-containing protein